MIMECSEVKKNMYENFFVRWQNFKWELTNKAEQNMVRRDLQLYIQQTFNIVLNTLWQ